MKTKNNIMVLGKKQVQNLMKIDGSENLNNGP